MTTIVTVSGSAYERVARGCATDEADVGCARSGRPIMAIPPSVTTADPPRQASRPQEWAWSGQGARRCQLQHSSDVVQGPMRGAPVAASKNCGASPANVTKTVLPSGENPYAGPSVSLSNRRPTRMPGRLASAGAIMVCPARRAVAAQEDLGAVGRVQQTRFAVRRRVEPQLAIDFGGDVDLMDAPWQRRRLPAPVREGSAVGREIDAVVLGGARHGRHDGCQATPIGLDREDVRHRAHRRIRCGCRRAAPTWCLAARRPSSRRPGRSRPACASCRARYRRSTGRGRHSTACTTASDRLSGDQSDQVKSVRGSFKIGRTPDPSGAAIISVASWGDTVRRNVSCVPSRVYPTAKSSVGPVMTAWACVPSGSATRMSPSAL